MTKNKYYTRVKSFEIPFVVANEVLYSIKGELIYKFPTNKFTADEVAKYERVELITMYCEDLQDNFTDLGEIIPLENMLNLTKQEIATAFADTIGYYSMCNYHNYYCASVPDVKVKFTEFDENQIKECARKMNRIA